MSSPPAANGGGLSIREHLAASGCETPNRPLLVAKNSTLMRAIIYRPNCKQWKCKYCGPVRARWFMVVAHYGHEQLLQSDQEVMFTTITSHEKVKSLRVGISRWRENWPRLLRRAKRKSADMAYLQIPEQHMDGRLHVHLLTTATVTQRWLKDNARNCGFGYIAEIEPVKEAGLAAWYVAKYLTKDALALTWPKYFRRVNTSRNWPRPPALSTNKVWTVERIADHRTVEQHKRRLEVKNWSVEVYTPW